MVLMSGITVSNHSARKIGFIPQKALLFTGTIADNLRSEKRTPVMRTCTKQLIVAQAKDFIESREEGFATHLAEGGSNLSGGQKQRLSIARAVIKAQISIFLTILSQPWTTVQMLFYAVVSGTCSKMLRY